MSTTSELPDLVGSADEASDDSDTSEDDEQLEDKYVAGLKICNV